LTGFWHGASWNFIVWGLYFALLLMLEKLVLMPVLEKIGALKHVYVMILIIISFVIFNAADMGEALVYIGSMFGMGDIPFLSAEAVYYFRSNAFVLGMAIVGATPVCKRLFERTEQSKIGAKVIGIFEPIFLVVLLLLCTAYLVDGSFNPFLYFRF
jgi:alginate O-acetyltransferase complex protein AlgI